MNEVNTIKPNEEYIDLMEDYYGYERKSYNIIVSAFSFNGIGRSKTIQTDAGIDVYQLVTSNPDEESKEIDISKIETATIGYTNPTYFQEMATHELGHSFLTEALREDSPIYSKVDELKFLFTQKLKDDMAKQGYTDWHTCFEEHIVRLGEIKMYEKLRKKKLATNYKQKCINERGFTLIPSMEEIFKEYETNRNRFKNIDSFIPILIAQLKIKVPVR
jgi:hypothetical protein